MDSITCEKCGKDYLKSFKSCPECYFRDLKILEKSKDGEGTQQCNRCGNVFEAKFDKCPYCSRLNVKRTFMVFMFIIALLTMIFISLRIDYIKSKSKSRSKKISVIEVNHHYRHPDIYSKTS